MRICLLSLFLLLSSCTHFKPVNLGDFSIDKSLEKIKLTGEGRGRLGVDQGNYVFSFEALLNDKKDWVLAIEIPLRGEEVMVLSEVDKVSSPNRTSENFEKRIEDELRARPRKKELRNYSFSSEIRSLIRFVMAPHLNLKRSCSEQSKDIYSCVLDEEKFMVSLFSGKIKVTKSLGTEYFFELTGENLTESYFTRTNFHFKSQKEEVSKGSLLSLELFWN